MDRFLVGLYLGYPIFLLLSVSYFFSTDSHGGLALARPRQNEDSCPLFMMVGIAVRNYWPCAVRHPVPSIVTFDSPKYLSS
ncbi:hypothetical protein EDD22DRAFT_293007 [Suillus occidentalis]|nr:hypothetical protein EDD22DRAFT_293007 [Suillus occidentalis]